MGTAIEWTEAVWNPVTGCSKVSEGCRNCYAFALHDMRHKAFLEGKKLPQQYAMPFSEIQLFPDRIIQPMKWREPRRVFVNSMADLFHPDVPFDFIDKVFAAMALSPKHTFQILTKRPARMLEYFQRDRLELIERWAAAAYEITSRDDEAEVFVYNRLNAAFPQAKSGWPIQNVWLGTSVENQKAADERIPFLLQVPAAVRFLSCEPLLGPVDLSGWLFTNEQGESMEPPIQWVIAGGESGNNARPMQPEWATELRDQCQAAGVAFFFKQFGEWAPVHELRCNEPGIKGKQWYNFDPDTSVCRVGKDRAGRLLDGREWSEFPGAI
ncbi:phage Gp37/Gp68 family protein [Brevibacillus nitrificans]|uniref:phage Gp37/Gp68 family protein n=1 Tax=Brevibacillus nitrificans TaxID=651560 RepID=UPI002E225161|nr:phage Gp37/Gp68 family protein [Brevibacillus nitrificans]